MKLSTALLTKIERIPLKTLAIIIAVTFLPISVILLFRPSSSDTYTPTSYSPAPYTDMPSSSSNMSGTSNMSPSNMSGEGTMGAPIVITQPETTIVSPPVSSGTMGGGNVMSNPSQGYVQPSWVEYRNQLLDERAKLIQNINWYESEIDGLKMEAHEDSLRAQEAYRNNDTTYGSFYSAQAAAKHRKIDDYARFHREALARISQIDSELQ